LLAAPGRGRLNVFISHTKRSSDTEQQSVADLVRQVRQVIADTRLAQFFDANDLQPGSDWDAALRENAGQSTLLAIRTDLYSSRAWCQREVLIAKQAGIPMIVMDALNDGERRGSFLMDHVARVPVRMERNAWRSADIVRALNMLVDASLAREVWRHQSELARSASGVSVAWWAPHAPEPVTLVQWLGGALQAKRIDAAAPSLVILYPDPPLGEDERSVLAEIVRICGVTQPLDLVTPRQLASRTN
jgi:hypothetical protein